MSKYLLNCFLLLIPIFIWNIIFIKLLPKAYTSANIWDNIPQIVLKTENILRIVVFILPLIMSLSLETNLQKLGLSIYISGVIIYFLSWILQIYFPESLWGNSMFGFMAPAYTTIIWFIGIGLVGQITFIRIPYFSIIYFSLASLFVIVHSLHAYIVYARL